MYIHVLYLSELPRGTILKEFVQCPPDSHSVQDMHVHSIPHGDLHIHVHTCKCIAKPYSIGREKDNNEPELKQTQTKNTLVNYAYVQCTCFNERDERRKEERSKQD